MKSNISLHHLQGKIIKKINLKLKLFKSNYYFLMETKTIHKKLLKLFRMIFKRSKRMILTLKQIEEQFSYK